MTFPVTYTPEPTKPSGGPTPGAVALLNFCIGEFDVAVAGDEIHSLGIYNPRDVCGNTWPNWKCKGSQHARGAAGDAGVPVQRPTGHSEGHRLANWLVANHAALGVQEVIFAGKRWSNGSQRWATYSGRSDHFDHVHFALNDPAASGLTMQMVQAVWQHNPPEDDMTEAQYEGIVNEVRAVGHKCDVIDTNVSDIHARTDRIEKAVASLAGSAGGVDGASVDEILDGLAARLKD